MKEKFLKEMFRTSKLPNVDFGLEDISRQVQKFTNKLSISGVQPKLSVKLDKRQNLLVPTAQGGEYILKPQTAAFPNIPENEQCCMDIAGECDIDIPPHCLIFLKDNSLAYLVKRFDRDKGVNPVRELRSLTVSANGGFIPPLASIGDNHRLKSAAFSNGVKIHQESFAQILEQADKYKGSVEQIGKKLKEISSVPGYDVQLFFERVILNFILGNGDAHLKNYSVSYRDKDDIRLSPAYDIVCSKLVIPDEEDSAITINGKKNKLQRSDFDSLAENLNVPVKIRYEKFENKFDVMEKIIESSTIDAQKQQRFLEIIKERMSRLLKDR